MSKRMTASAMRARKSLFSIPTIRVVQSPFTCALRVPNTLAELIAWLSFIGADLPKQLVAGVAQAWPRECFFLVRGPNGDVGGKLVIPRVLAKAVQRQQFLAQLLEKKAGDV